MPAILQCESRLVKKSAFCRLPATARIAVVLGLLTPGRTTKRLAKEALMSALFRGIIGAALVVAVGIPPASAQESGTPPVPVVEVSGGYTFMRDLGDNSIDGINFPAGWYASTTVNLNRWFGLVGEVTGSYKSNLDLGIEELNMSTNASEHTFMGGPRFAAKAGRLMPFGQFLAGAAHLRATVDMPMDIPGHFGVSDTQFAFQPGAGVNVLLTDNLGLHVAGDYRCIVDFTGDGNTYTNQVRFLTGFSFNWGGR
jgi:opacity protein-like surface antigen